MYVAEIKFLPLPETGEAKDQQELQSDAVQMVLGGWRQNGQILGKQFPIAGLETEAGHDNGFCCFVNLPEPQALSLQYNNHYISKWLEDLGKVGLAQPKITVLGKEPESTHVCECESQKTQILCTSYLNLESPLRCGKCFGVIPLYKMPPTYDSSEYYNIISWQTNYQAIDALQMNSAIDEVFMQSQLYNLSSDLNKQGQGVCQSLKRVTGKPVYYFLLQSQDGVSLEHERQRKCPSCGGNWHLLKPWHDLFDFKCNHCHLLSNMAWNIKNGG